MLVRISISVVISYFCLFNICFAEIPSNVENNKIKPSKIDLIKTANDIDRLLEKIDKKKFEYFIVDDKLKIETVRCGDFAEKIQAKSWTKADFDNNGLTDILIIGNLGNNYIVVLDKGNNKFDVEVLSRDLFGDCSLPTVKEVESQNLIVINTLRPFRIFKLTDEETLKKASETPPTIETKELIYKFGYFVELNKTPTSKKIEKISYETTMCFGTCPSFEIKIDTNRQAIYGPRAYNKLKKGPYKATISSSEFNDLVDLLNYIDFSNLKDNYSVNWTDDQTCFLTITYDGGKLKKIRDYGLIGTYGLVRVYEILFDLRENQVWKK